MRSGWLRGSIYWVLLVLGSALLFQNHYPRFTGAPSCRFRTLTRRPPSVDSGLARFNTGANEVLHFFRRWIWGREHTPGIGTRELLAAEGTPTSGWFTVSNHGGVSPKRTRLPCRPSPLEVPAVHGHSAPRFRNPCLIVLIPPATVAGRLLAGGAESGGTRTLVGAGMDRTWGKTAILPPWYGQGRLPRLYG